MNAQDYSVLWMVTLASIATLSIIIILYIVSVPAQDFLAYIYRPVHVTGAHNYGIYFMLILENRSRNNTTITISFY